MGTQGNYQERLDQKNYQFTSKPLTRDFQYRTATTWHGTRDWKFHEAADRVLLMDGGVIVGSGPAATSPRPGRRDDGRRSPDPSSPPGLRDRRP